MFPGSVTAALLLLALVPGYLFLRLTESVRRPREDTALAEVLEVCAVGLGTTGVAVLVGIYFWPNSVRRLHDATLSDPGSIRFAAVAIVGTLAASLLISATLSVAVRGLSNERYARNGVWSATLGLSKPGHLPHAMVRLKDGRSIDGVLHAYTTVDGETPRDIALVAPIGLTVRGARTKLDTEYLIVSGDQIDLIGMKLNRDPGADA